MAANPEKFQAMFLGTPINDICLSVDGVKIKSSSVVKLLGVHFDNKLNFQTHVQITCKSVSQKINALRRIRPFLNIECAKRLCTAYILSKFQYCPLIWMFGSKSNNLLINKTHQRALRTVYNDFESSLEELIEKDKSVVIHVQHLRTLMIEVFKSLNRLNPEMLWEIFTPKESHYILRNGSNLSLPRTNSSKFGTRSLAFRGSITWNSLSASLKCAESIKHFKSKIKKWDGKTCNCNICK